MDTQTLQRLMVNALEDVKGQDIQVFDTEHLSPLFSCVVLATGSSNRQTRALAERVREVVKAAGGYVGNMEGEGSGEWVLLDCGDAILHVMLPVFREYYNLEELWGDRPVPLAQIKATVAAKAGADKLATKNTKGTKSTKGTKKTKTGSVDKAAASSKQAAAKKPAASKRASSATGKASGAAPSAKKTSVKAVTKSAAKPTTKTASKAVSTKRVVGTAAKTTTKLATKPATKSATKSSASKTAASKVSATKRAAPKSRQGQ